MSNSFQIDLKRAQVLCEEGKYDESLHIIENFEGKEELSIREKIDWLNLKGRVYLYLYRIDEAIAVAEFTLHESNTQGDKYQVFDALFVKCVGIFMSNFESIEVNNLLERIQSIFQNLKNISHAERLKRESDLMSLKGNINYILNKDFDKAVECLNKSLKITKVLGNKGYIGEALFQISNIYSSKGEFDQAMKYIEKTLIDPEIPKFHHCRAHGLLGNILLARGELEEASKISEQWSKLAKEIQYKPCIASSLKLAGEIYRIRGDLDLALEYGKRSLNTLVNTPTSIGLRTNTLSFLIELCVEAENYREAEKYLNDYKLIVDELKREDLNKHFQLSKAILLKSSSNIRDLIKAEMFLKEFLEFDIPQFSMDAILNNINEMALVHLCDLLLVELRMSNDVKLIDEIDRIINRLSKNAKNQNSFWKLAETYLLKAKLSFIEMNMGEARKFLTHAQEIADEKGFGLLAQKISDEHDKLLEQLSKWDNTKEDTPPLSERIELSSFEGVIERLLEKRVIDSPEVTEEQPILLLILTEGGVLLFSYPFNDEWKRDHQIFGSFLTAFTSFTDEFFSEGLDRAKFGQYTVLIESVNSFSIGYVYKGNSYPAKQKLKYFIERIKGSASIWQMLEKFYQTSQAIEYKDYPFLEAFVTEIFSGNAPNFKKEKKILDRLLY
jgi:tetratricopeptide (TPR) repeat protein